MVDGLSLRFSRYFCDFDIFDIFEIFFAIFDIIDIFEIFSSVSSELLDWKVVLIENLLKNHEPSK